MALTRQWVRTGEGEDLVLAGTEGAVVQENEDRGSLAWSAWFYGPWMLLYRWLRRERGRGRVEVGWRDEAWAWETSDKHAAYHVANRVQHLLASGAWVPVSMPQPRVAGAEVAPVYH